MKKRILSSISLLFTIMVVFVLMWHYGVFAENKPDLVSPTTIIFTNSQDIEYSTSTDTVTKQEYCSMAEHAGNPSCGTDSPSDHPISTMWNPADRKVTITIEKEVVGYGQAKATVTSGTAVIGDQTIDLSNLGGDVENVGSWGDSDNITRAKYSPEHEVYFYCPEDAEPNTYTWELACKVEIWGIDWEGSKTSTVTIGNSVGVSFGLSSAGTYSVTNSFGNSNTLTSDVSSNPSHRKRSPSDTWILEHDSVCGHVQCWKSLTDPHAHHWWCPSDNGCSYHIVCEDYTPDKHKSHASCWNLKKGCHETDVRKCTHVCEYEEEEEEKVICAHSYCSEVIKSGDAYEHFETCGQEDDAMIDGCGVPYWTCQLSNLDHTELTCTRDYIGLPPCGETFRKCSNPGWPLGGCDFGKAHIWDFYLNVRLE